MDNEYGLNKINQSAQPEPLKLSKTAKPSKIDAE
jgi:hypothetical protein